MAYPFLVHISIYFQLTHWVTCLLPVLFYLLFSPLCPTTLNSKDYQIGISCFAKKSFNIKIFFLIILIIFSVLSVILQDYSLLYIPPILINILILLPFIRSITPDYIPLLTQFYYLTEELKRSPKDAQIKLIYSPKREYYTTVLTWIWISLISLMLVEIILLSFFAPIQIWSLFTNFINYLILSFFIITEWIFRNIYFMKWDSPLVFIKQLILIDYRQLLKKR